jgi:hypothetical protein
MANPPKIVSGRLYRLSAGDAMQRCVPKIILTIPYTRHIVYRGKHRACTNRVAADLRKKFRNDCQPPDTVSVVFQTSTSEKFYGF